MARLQLSLLGPFQVCWANQIITNYRTDKVRALLAYLVVEPQPHERSKLAGLFWPEMHESTALRNLSQTLSRLRDVIHDAQTRPSFLQVSRQTVQWNPTSDYELDVAQFLSEVQPASQPVIQPASQPATSEPIHVHQLSRGVARYQGEFLAGFGLVDCPDFETWLMLKRERLRQVALDAMQSLAAAALATALASQDIASATRAQHYARAQLALEPWRESAHRTLMQALMVEGRRSEALAQYEQCRHILANDLDVEPEPATLQLYQQIRSGSFSPIHRTHRPTHARREPSDEAAPAAGAAPPPPHHNLPTPVSPFIGRAVELRQLETWLRSGHHRCITITGLGGVGKTRLALKAAQALADAFADGVWFVSLVSIDSNLHGNNASADQRTFIRDVVARAILDALGIQIRGITQIQAELLEALRARRLLLVLDNVEHVLDPISESTAGPVDGPVAGPAADGESNNVALLADILQAAPGVVILTTSRERLQLTDETILALDGLPATLEPQPDNHGSLSPISAGVQLFIEHANRLWPGFTVAAEDLPKVARICQLVDGLPLGIELAASWVQHLSLIEIAQAIQHNLDFLASPQRDRPARQSSMRAVIDYTWQRLSPREQIVLTQMSVFRGSFSREAVQTVTGVTMSQLVQLVNKSLLRSTGQGRYDLHELLRQYFSEQLTKLGTMSTTAHTSDQTAAQTVADRHSAYYLGWVASHTHDLFSEHAKQVTHTLLADLDNIRQAWHWAIARRHYASLLQAARAMNSLYSLTSLTEGEAEFTHAIHQLEQEMQAQTQRAQEAPQKLKQVLAHLKSDLAFFLNERSKYDEVIKVTQHGAAYAAACGDAVIEALNIYQQGEALRRQREWSASAAQFQRCLKLVESGTPLVPLHDPSHSSRIYTETELVRGWSWVRLGYIHAQHLRFAEAIGCTERGLQVFRVSNFHRYESNIMNFMGEIARRSVDYERSLHQRQQALALVHRYHDPDIESRILNNIGDLYVHLGVYTQAIEHYERALRLSQQIGNMRVEQAILEGMSRAYRHMGDLPTALHCARRTVDLAETLGVAQNMGYPLISLGQAFERMSILHEVPEMGPTHTAAGPLPYEFFEAEAAYHRGLRFMAEVPLPSAVAELKAGLARLALRRHAVDQALTYVAELLEEIAQGCLADTLEPMTVYLSCYEVLRDCGDTRADTVLAQAQSLLHTAAHRIQDPALRHSFLHNVAAHRALADLVAEQARGLGAALCA